MVVRDHQFSADIIEMCTLTQGASGLMLYRDGDEINELPEIAAEIGRKLVEDAPKWH
ncbi:MAG: hypothetical protein JWR11_893 [Mycobacterium sp.]|nr:hypothetical protein [Mycobacterium sp.]